MFLSVPPLFVFDRSRYIFISTANGTSLTSSPTTSRYHSKSPIKFCKFLCPYCLFKDCVMCTFYCDWPWYTGYTLEFQTQSQDTLKGKTLPSSSPNQTQETLKGKTLPSSRPIQIQDTLKGKTLPSSRLNQTHSQGI